MEVLIPYTIVVALFACLVIPFLSSRQKALMAFVAIFLNATVTSFFAVTILTGGSDVSVKLNGGLVFGQIGLLIDALAAWFILIINFTCLTGAVYGIHYMKAYSSLTKSLSLHWCFFIFFHCSMIWVCILQNSLAFLAAWEIMSISSFLLVMFDHTRIGTVKAGINYLIQMHIGVACLTVAFIMVSWQSNDYDLNRISSYLLTGNSFWLLLFFFLGFGIKAGFVPLHTWLPHAHPAAPSHVSGVMSGVIVKMGIYGILRILTYLSNDLVTVGIIILIVSVVTAFYGILSGAIHRDIKRMLAFCTIENVGIIGMGIGIGVIGKGLGSSTIMVIGFSSALLHTLNHSLFKSLLFFATGTIYQQTHSRNMEQLGGLIKKIPITGFFFLCGSLAISGLPPFNGFISKFLLFSGFIEGIKVYNNQFAILMIVSIIGLALAGGLSLLTFTKAFSIIFLGSPRTQSSDHAKEVSHSALFPFYIIFFCMLIIGVFPALTFEPIQYVILLMDKEAGTAIELINLSSILSYVGLVSFALIFTIAGVFFIRNRIVRKKTVTYSATWGCGYPTPNVHMQYTAKSFSKSLAKLFHFITQEEKKYSEIESTIIFPSSRSYRSNYIEFFEKKIISKITKSLLIFISWFSFVHNGRVRMYILYGFIFILFLFVATIFELI